MEITELDVYLTGFGFPEQPGKKELDRSSSSLVALLSCNALYDPSPIKPRNHWVPVILQEQSDETRHGPFQASILSQKRQVVREQVQLQEKMVQIHSLEDADSDENLQVLRTLEDQLEKCLIYSHLSL